MINLEKPDIVEVISLYVDLQEHGYGDRPYYTGFCPLHNNTKTPAFAVYPAIQRFYCYGCSPEGGDVIDFIAKLKGITKTEAIKEICHEITAAQSLKKKLNKITNTPIGIDTYLFNLRIRNLYIREGVTNIRPLVKEIVCYIKEKKFSLANKILSERGV